MDQTMIPLPEQETERELPARMKKSPPRTGGLVKAALGCSLLALAVSLAALWTAWPKEKPEPVPLPEPYYEVATQVEYITYRGHQLPIDDAVPANELDVQAFAPAEGGRIGYENALHGIDISSHQGEIDWEQVAASGMEFAMIRAGYRGYGPEGKLMEDERFHANIQGALAAGMDVGIYFFSQATNVWEAEEETQLLLRSLEGYPVTYPVVFDWERIHHSAARTDGVEGKTVTLMAQAFCAQVEQAGYTPGIYFNQDMGYLELELDELSEYAFWLAEYDAAPEFYYHFDLWQYTSQGTVPGISTPVDLNLSFRDFGIQASSS